MLRRLVRASLVLVCAACFSEDPTESGSNDANGSGGECPVGTLACPCDGEACNEGLACEASVSLCIDPSCTPGSSLCTCVDGVCLEGLQCMDGLCRGGDGETSMPLTTSAETSVMTTLATDTGDPPGSSGQATTDVSTSTTGGSSTGMPVCTELPCEECRHCVVGTGQTCNLAWGTCQDVDACGALADCTIACPEADEPCVQSCCLDLGQEQSGLYNGGVANCIMMACAGCTPDLQCP